MPLTKTSSAGSTQTQRSESTSPARPQFNSRLTADRLREARTKPPPFNMSSNIKKNRRSIFKETGLDDDSRAPSPTSSSPVEPEQGPVTVENENDFGDIANLPSEPTSNTKVEDEKRECVATMTPSSNQHQRRGSLPSRPWYAKLANPLSRPRVRSTSSASPGTISGLQRYTMIALLMAIVIPALSYRNGHSRVEMSGADAGVIQLRENSPTDVCKRWAHQAVLLNGTLYIYGGEAMTDEDQTDNTWNNNFLTLDLTKDWDTKKPSFTGLELPDGPPAVANGYLWHDYNNLYLYGGQFSTKPYTDPAPESVWRYGISSKKWTEFSNPKTSDGNYSEPADQSVHRAAEGAGISVPELGISWYFGGHLDWATTPGWSTQIDRVYLKSLLEFTHPGYVNTGVDDLSGDSGAGEEGAFRNITEGGVQAGDFTERADGALVYIPGWGDLGVLIGLAGGTENTFAHDLGSLDVYDIASSEWFHQKTSGDIPEVRVNPCAVVASAPDGSSFQVYMFGGQNLPFGYQTQYDDMYVLTIPSFSWIKVDQSDQSVPSPRSGHSCTMQDGQIILVGGYIGEDKGCDSPGVYVFDATSMKWQDSFRAGDHSADTESGNTVLAGSYGYSVPDAVQKVIGGDKDGKATVSTPAAGKATGGPFATGTAPVLTVTQAGATATVTNGHGGSNSNSDSDDSSGGGVNPGLISAGVVAGIAGALALYLGFCAWLYRRQISKYRQHLAVANRYSGASAADFNANAGLFAGRGRDGHERSASRTSDETFGWVGSDRERHWLTEPKWTSDETSPGEISGTASGSGSAPKRSTETRPRTSGSAESAEGLIEGQEPSFFSVVMRPRRALRVVNTID